MRIIKRSSELLRMLAPRPQGIGAMALQAQCLKIRQSVTRPVYSASTFSNATLFTGLSTETVAKQLSCQSSSRRNENVHSLNSPDHQSNGGQDENS